MAELPGGTVTLIFTDIEGSTRLLTSLGSRYEAFSRITAGTGCWLAFASRVPYKNTRPST